MALLELNINHTGMGFGITDKTPLLLDRGQFQGESKAAAGKDFQKERHNKQPAYIGNCVFDNGGLLSVSFSPINTTVLGRDCYIGEAVDCDTCKQLPYLHNGISFIHRNKSFLFTENNQLFMLDVSLKSTYVDLRGLDKSKLKDVVDIVSIQGKRIVVMTEDEIYYSSLLDGTGKTGSWASDEDTTTSPYIQFYELAGATGKFSISASIGKNKRMVVNANNLYFLGSTGGIISTQCNQDDDYPFVLSVINDFDGIAHRDHANVKSDKLSGFLALSQAGLGIIDGPNFLIDFDDISNNIRRDMAVYFKVYSCGELVMSDKCTPCEGSISEGASLSNEAVTFYTEGETITSEGDYEEEGLERWDKAMYFEQSGTDETHTNIVSTERYYIVSYNSGVVLNDCAPSCLCYNRLYLYDKRAKAGTILHVEHKDVDYIAGSLIINSEGGLREMVLKHSRTMPSFIYYKGLQLDSEKWVQLSELLLKGKLEKPDDTGFNSPVFTVTTDDSGMFYHDEMELYHASQHDVKYGNIIRGEKVDFIIPFKGYVSSIKLNYNR